MAKSWLARRAQLEQQYEDMVAEIESIDKILSVQSDTRLHVIKSIFPNVKIIIDSCSTVTRSTVASVTFYRYKGEVTFTACEAK